MVRKINHRQKNVSLSLIAWIQRYRKEVQIKENIKYGRKARSISFVEATASPSKLAKFIVENKK